MGSDTTTGKWSPEPSLHTKTNARPTLVLLHCASAPERVGELVFLDDVAEPRQLGRNGTLSWVRARPGSTEATGPIDDPLISRIQLELTTEQGETHVKNVGRMPLKLNGHPIHECELRLGDLLELGDRVMLRVSDRDTSIATSAALLPLHAFGQPDRTGWVGESSAAWALRARVAFVAARQTHVLVTGPSGSGKEIVAHALHALSPRGGRAMVSRNAATIPESIADVELFGHAAGYPNPGMPARLGLIGEADGTTLFLDEFGELPVELQARLLRVMDAGEYSRLGEARPRRADLRLIAATNRDPATLKHDVLARLKIEVAVPPLSERIDDIPLLAVHLLRLIARNDPALAPKIFPEGDTAAAPLCTARLVRQLVCHTYSTHVRELERLLWRAITGATGVGIDALEPETFRAVAAPSIPQGPLDPGSLDPDVVQAVLDRHGGWQEPAWKELGLSSRHVLARFVKKHQLRVRKRG